MNNNIIIVDSAKKTLRFNDKVFACSLGKGGSTDNKREGDGKTPLGTFAMRELFWRFDKLGAITYQFKQATIITPDMGWCDDPQHVEYNQLVKLPFSASHEKLWRDDIRYDIIIPLGYNDSPAVAGLGSAIFFHLIDDLNASTEGCVATQKAAMIELLPFLNENYIIQIT
jgi:L,D-peptidoglycan transpeptidase YkuD (ErfK/YbiS/YcfS/YnhG family)